MAGKCTSFNTVTFRMEYEVMKNCVWEDNLEEENWKNLFPSSKSLNFEFFNLNWIDSWHTILFGGTLFRRKQHSFAYTIISREIMTCWKIDRIFHLRDYRLILATGFFYSFLSIFTLLIFNSVNTTYFSNEMWLLGT